jgi:hypothetical protein
MRSFVASAALCAAIALSGVPVLAQTVTASIQLTNAGPVTSCTPHATLRFQGTINTANWSGPRQVQYKWTYSDAGDQATQTLNLPSGATTSNPVINTLGDNHTSGGWVQLIVSYPTNVSSSKLNWKLICPTVGSLSAPSTLRPEDLIPGLQVLP